MSHQVTWTTCNIDRVELSTTKGEEEWMETDTPTTVQPTDAFMKGAISVQINKLGAIWDHKINSGAILVICR